MSDEPINLYRYRWWVLSKLLDVDNNQKVNTSSSWKFEFDVNNDSSKWLKLDYKWTTVATINENTWKITIINPTYTFKVIPSNNNSNDVWYVKVLLMNWTNELYYQYFKFDSNSNIKIVDDFNSIGDNGIYIKLNDKTNYSSYKVPLTVQYNPWAIVIYSSRDTFETPLFVIFKDWRINTFWWNKLEYRNEWENVKFNLVSPKWIPIWEVLMKMTNWNYIMK